jgi:hypothetical protein
VAVNEPVAGCVTGIEGPASRVPTDRRRTMKLATIVAAVTAALGFAAAPATHAGSTYYNVTIGGPGYGVTFGSAGWGAGLRVGVPVYPAYAPAPVYLPPPVYVTPPVVYAPYPVYRPRVVSPVVYRSRAVFRPYPHAAPVPNRAVARVRYVPPPAY